MIIPWRFNVPIALKNVAEGRWVVRNNSVLYWPLGPNLSRPEQLGMAIISHREYREAPAISFKGNPSFWNESRDDFNATNNEIRAVLCYSESTGEPSPHDEQCIIFKKDGA